METYDYLQRVYKRIKYNLNTKLGVKQGVRYDVCIALDGYRGSQH